MFIHTCYSLILSKQMPNLVSSYNDIQVPISSIFA